MTDTSNTLNLGHCAESVRLLAIYSAIDCRYNWAYRRACRTHRTAFNHDNLSVYELSNMALRRVHSHLADAHCKAVGSFKNHVGIQSKYNGLLYRNSCVNQRCSHLSALKNALAYVFLSAV